MAKLIYSMITSLDGYAKAAEGDLGRGAEDDEVHTFERTFDPDAVRRLKAESDHDLSVDGPNLAAQAIAADLVDEYHLFITTSVVGGGTRFFPDGSISSWSTSGRSTAGCCTRAIGSPRRSVSGRLQS